MSASIAIVLAIPALAALYLLYRIIIITLHFRQLEEFSAGLAAGNLQRRLYLRGRHGFSRIVSNLSVVAALLEEKMRETDFLKRRTDQILKSIPSGIVVLDSKNRVRSANPVFEQMFHYRQTTGKKGITEATNISSVNALIESARNENSGKTETYQVNSKYVETSVVPFAGDQEKYAGAVMIFRDVTGEKRIDEIRRDFVANVSHELKTPVTAIKGYVETLLDGALDNREDAVKFLNIVKFQSERMDQLVKDLITLSRIEFGAVPMEIAAVSLSGIVDSAASLFMEKANAKGLYIKKEIPGQCAEIQADPMRLTQIITNLLDNAIKYTDTGGVTIRAREDEHYRCVLTIQDTGIGVPKKFISRLGERFFRVDPSRSRELGGTGLGLAIVKHLVLAHGWKMNIDSEPGKGTTIRIYMP